MKILHYRNYFPKTAHFSPGVPHHDKCPLKHSWSSSGYKIVVTQPTHQQTLWTPLNYIPHTTNSHSLHQQQPSLNHYHLWPKPAFENVNLLCHSLVQNSPVASITDTIKSEVTLVSYLSPHSPPATQASFHPGMCQAHTPLAVASISVSSRYLKS